MGAKSTAYSITFVGAREQVPRGRDAEHRLTADIARQDGRYGYRKVAALLCQAGWQSMTSGSSVSGNVSTSRSGLQSHPRNEHHERPAAHPSLRHLGPNNADLPCDV